MTDHQSLRRIAEAATPGPWAREYHPTDGWIFSAAEDAPDGDIICLSPNDAEVESLAEWHRANAEFIATFNPAQVIALLDEIAELKAADDDPAEGLPGELTDIARWAANGQLLNGGEIENIEEAARRLQASESLARSATERAERLEEALQEIANGDYRIISGSPGPLFSAGWAGCGRAIADRARSALSEKATADE